MISRRSQGRKASSGINEADKRDVIDADALRRALDDHAGAAGVRPLRWVLDKHTFRLSDDELERLFRPLATAAGLPTPSTKVMVNDFEVDFYWPDLGLDPTTSRTSSEGRRRTCTAPLHPH